MLHYWFMQDPKASHARKPWYQRAVEMATMWRTVTKPAHVPPSSNGTVWKTPTKPSKIHSPDDGINGSRRPKKLRKCSSQRIATSFTRVCLCSPISTYTGVFRAENVPPRRSNSYPRSKSISGLAQQERGSMSPTSPRPSMELLGGGGGRVRVRFRGKSLRDDVLMRRFVVEEEVAMLQIRRRNQMEAIRRRSLVRRRRKLGPSPLSRMVKAEEEEEEEEELI